MLAQHRLDHDADAIVLRVPLGFDPTRGEHVAQRADEAGLAERLRDVVDGTGLDGASDRVAGGVAGERDDRHRALFEDASGRLDAVELGQVEVDQDQVGTVLARELDRLDAVARVGADVEAVIQRD